MTVFFSFDELTWPEVAALPRSTPLVLPLGQGYSLERLSEALQDPPQVGLLPALPYGWRSSGLAVSERTLCTLLQNLLGGLRADGFSRVWVMAPAGLELDLGSNCLGIPVQGSRLPAGPMPADELRERVVLVPAGHTEQHGLHLPLCTDTLIINSISRETAQASPQRVITLPTFPYGVSTHRPAFAGTFNCGGRAFEDFFLEVVDALAKRGFEKLYLLSGHGGNCSFFTNVVKYAGERYPGGFCATAWLYLSGPKGLASLQALRQSPLGGMGHACELETSLMLYLRPRLVHMERAVDEVNFITTPSYTMDWVEGGALIANPPWEDDTATGAYGAGSLGTAEKGQAWLHAAVEEKLDHVEEIHEQYRKRFEKRNAR